MSPECSLNFKRLLTRRSGDVLFDIAETIQTDPRTTGWEVKGEVRRENSAVDFLLLWISLHLHNSIGLFSWYHKTNGVKQIWSSQKIKFTQMPPMQWYEVNTEHYSWVITLSCLMSIPQSLISAIVIYHLSARLLNFVRIIPPISIGPSLCCPITDGQFVKSEHSRRVHKKKTNWWKEPQLHIIVTQLHCRWQFVTMHVKNLFVKENHSYELKMWCLEDHRSVRMMVMMMMLTMN